MTAINELYLVQNGVDDVVDNDHNTLVEASEFLNDTLGDLYNFGNGRDGNIKLGSIATNPTTAPTCIATGTGPLTATYYYQYSVYNLSGETDVSNSSSTVSPSSQNVQVTIPAYVTNSNVTGFYLYRSIDDVTYYRIATIPVEDATQGATWIDEIPATSGTAPAGSNTTGTTATFGGIINASSVTIQSGQTVTLSSTYPYLIIRCSGDVTIAGTVNGNDLMADAGGLPEDMSFTLANAARVVRLSTYGGPAIFQGTDIRSFGGYAAINSSQLTRSNSRWMFKPGSGGTGYGSSTSGKAGGTLFIAAKGYIDVSTSTINFNGGVGTATFGDGGGAGGTVVLYSTKYIKRTAATISANGGAASTSTGSAPAGSGGGGGIVVACSPFVIGSSTTTVNGGAAGSANGSSGGGYCGATGGGNGGAGGAGGYSTGAGNAGSAGIILDTTPQVMSLPRV